MNATRLLKHIALALFVLAFVALPQGAQASIAYGSINNFDTVNDTGHECHGFEIEIEDCRSTDITYTYNYNHYGAPRIEQDDSIVGHPKCRIRWESKKNADGSWAAYTAIPSGPINPTNGHMFTNPSVNFGGEHFGVGYRVSASVVKYNWLIDNGAGVLVHGGAVQVSTPTFTYYPPVVGNPAPARVQAVIAPPVPPVPPVKQFGKAVWVKEIKTTTHNNKEVKLRDLVSDDPVDPNDKNWANGEPDEVEVEWRILQKRNIPGGGANDELAAAPEDLPNGDEVVTRRYEFYKYTGPLDAESDEAMADAVDADGLHGTGMRTYNHHMVGGEWVTVTEDMATIEVVGDFTGSQMAAVDVDAPVGLIDHVGEGRINTVFVARTVVIEGVNPFTALQEGNLPPGMTFNEVTGVLSGTPTASGEFQFKITASDGVNPDVSKNYTLVIAAAGAALPPASLLDTVVSPVGAGTTTGDGSYDVGANATVTAAAVPGFAFLNWTDNGKIVSTNTSHTLAMDVNHSLIANFVPTYLIGTSAVPAIGGTTSGDGIVNEGASVTVTATANAGYTFTQWTEGGLVVSNTASFTFNAASDRDLVAHFAVIGVTRTISVSAGPGGTAAGGGTVADGSSVTVTVTPDAGYTFVNWTEGGVPVCAVPSHTFSATANRTLVAHFQPVGGGPEGSFVISAAASPLAGGSITGTGNHAPGASVTLHAFNNAGYQFTKWTESGIEVSTLKDYTFTVNSSRTLTAVFVPALSIGVLASPPQGGFVEADAPSYTVGDGADVQADANPGYTFLNWTENGSVVSTDAKYIFTINTSRTLVANFYSSGSVTIDLSASPAAGGVVSGGGSIAIGAPVTALAGQADGYKFSHWSEGGVRVNTDKDYQFDAAVNRTLVANFVEVPATGMKETEDPDEVELEWPEASDGWILQESSDMVNWVNSTRPVNIGGGKKKSRVNKIVNPKLFFRLVKP
ncbi:putative Ig domain-containing protein [Prosthecobacter sp.]|uniref:InlB B-repeat-containing protein n=1 Tax=Prosthecobacter sp. TaxID=1965333 RepID=UPI002AB91CD2|nr:putative Ig domain-containing protein [Prosthecobacter sp.]MDZ4402281.1 putative Ig domain-containing protein [Prosthecobacter sp.]